jgi:NADH-quinone oxidoreductase subunit E
MLLNPSAAPPPTEPEVLETLGGIVARFDRRRALLVPILQAVQAQCAYLPPETMPLVGRHLGIAASEVYGVASFYNQFRFFPPGRHPIRICLGTACHVKAGDIILENFERKLGIQEGQTTADREFSLERVACVGCCALAPVAIVGETVHGHMQPSKVEGLLLQIQIAREKAQREAAAASPQAEDPSDD